MCGCSCVYCYVYRSCWNLKLKVCTVTACTVYIGQVMKRSKTKNGMLCCYCYIFCRRILTLWCSTRPFYITDYVSFLFLTRSCRGAIAKYCDQRVCVSSNCLSSVSLSDRSHVYKSTGRNFTKSSAYVPVAVAASCSDDSAIRCVCPVLWMTSCFHIMGPMKQNQRRRSVKFARWRHREQSLYTTAMLWVTPIWDGFLKENFGIIRKSDVFSVSKTNSVKTLKGTQSTHDNRLTSSFVDPHLPHDGKKRTGHPCTSDLQLTGWRIDIIDVGLHCTDIKSNSQLDKGPTDYDCGEIEHKT